MNTVQHPAVHVGDAEERVLAVVRDVYFELHGGDANRSVSVTSRLTEDLGFDSLSRVELANRLEDRLAIRCDTAAVLSARSVGALVALMKRALGQGEVVARPAGGDLPAGFEHGSGRRACPDSIATLTDALAWQADHAGDLVHVHWYEDGVTGALTYRELYEDSLRIAAQLAAVGVGCDDKVAIMLPTGAPLLQSFFGALFCGAVPVPLYPPTDAANLEDHLSRQAGILRNCRAKVLLSVKEAKRFEALTRERCPALRRFMVPADVTASSAIEEAPRAGGGSVAMLQYTSGSTGDPKGVILTHENLLSNMRIMGQAVAVNPQDTFVSWLPLYHDMGLIGAWLGSLYHGIPLVLMSPLNFLARPVRWLRAISECQGTLSAGPNFAYQLCADKIRDDELTGIDLRSWRIAFNGAEPVIAATLRRFSERFSSLGFRSTSMAPVYGLAENSLGLLFPPLGRGPRVDRISREALHSRNRAELAAETAEDVREVPSCGRVIPEHDVRIVDESGIPLPDRIVGRLQFRGVSATAGYFGNDKANSKLRDGSWLNSGDFAYGADGEYFITGREKDLIIRAGRNLYPQEIEEIVSAIPGIRRGCVAAFAAAGGSRGTEELVVVAETREIDTDRHRALAQEIRRAIATSLDCAPDQVVIVPPRTIPKTSSGKLRRSDTRQRYEQGTLLARPAATRQIAHIMLQEYRARIRNGMQSIGPALYAGWAWGCFLCGAAVALLGCLVLPSVPLRRRLVHYAARGLLAATGLRLRVHGKQYFECEEGRVVVANHASYLDAIILTAALPPRYAFVAKRDFMNAKGMHFLLALLGTKFVERTDARRSVEDAGALERFLRGGERLVFFPEGTFSKTKGLLPFRLGAFSVAAACNSAVVPVAIRGSREAMPDGRWTPKRGEIVVAAGEPVAPTGAGWGAAVSLRDSVRARILAQCGEVDAQASGGQ